MEDQSSRPVSASSPPVHSRTPSSPPPPPPAALSSSSSSSPLSHSVNGTLDPLAAAVKVSCGTLAITSSSGVITPVFASTSSSPSSSSSSSSSSSPPCKSPHIATCLLTSNPDIEPHTQVTHITESTEALNSANHMIMPSITATSPPSMMTTSSPSSPPPTPIMKSAPHSASAVTSFTSQVMSNLTSNNINSNVNCGTASQQQQAQQQQSWYSRTPVHLFHPSSGATIGSPSPPSSTIGLMSASGTVDHHQWGALTAAVVPYVSSPHSSPTLYSHASHPNMVHHASAAAAAAAAAANAGVQQYTDVNAYYNSYYGTSGENFAAVAELMASPPQSNESMSHAFNPSSGTMNSSISHSGTHHSSHSHHHTLAGFSPRSSSSILMSSSASPIVDPLSPASEVSPASSTGTSSSVCQSDQLDMKPTTMALLSDHSVGDNNLHSHDENIASLNTHFHHHPHSHHHSHHHLHFRSLQSDNCDLPSLDNSGVIPKVEADATSPSLVSSTSSMVGSFISSNGSNGHSNNLHLLHPSSEMNAAIGQSRPQAVRSPYEWMSTSKKCNSNNHSNGNSQASNGNNNNNASSSSNNNNNGSNSNNSSNNSNSSSYPPSQAPPGKTRTRDKYRVVYSDHQRVELEKEFATSKYITIRRKSDLASMLALSERQVKIWFQNRRAKDRKQTKKREEGKSKDNNISHHHHSMSNGGGNGGQMSTIGQTSHHMLSKDGLIINSTMGNSNVQTAGALTGMVSPAYGTVLSSLPSSGLMGESALKMQVGTASPPSGSSPSSPPYTQVLHHHHHQLNHHHLHQSHQPHSHHHAHLLNYGESAHCNHY